MAPPYNYAAVSVSNVVATFCQYEALKHVSFPMQVRAAGAAANCAAQPASQPASAAAGARCCCRRPGHASPCCALHPPRCPFLPPLSEL